MIKLCSYESPLGPMTLAGEEGKLIGCWFDGQKYDRMILKGRSFSYGSDPILEQTVSWLDLYFSGQKPSFMPALYFHGSPFQKMIWELLTEIPYGEVRTYGEIAVRAAEKTGRSRMAAQAVGGAVGHNPISVIVPCHRVIGSSGSLTGYAGGLSKKEYLLHLEGYI